MLIHSKVHSAQARHDYPAIDFVWHLTHVDNLPSIFLSATGLLSKTYLAEQLGEFEDISLPQAQAFRERAEVFGEPLHNFVPTYICQRNPMMYLRRSEAASLVWLKIDVNKLSVHDCYTADRNAASPRVRFFKGVQANALNWNVIKANYWCDYADGKSLRCAELLVHKRIDCSAIVAVEVANINLLATLKLTLGLSGIYNPAAFFSAASNIPENKYANLSS